MSLADTEDGCRSPQLAPGGRCAEPRRRVDDVLPGLRRRTGTHPSVCDCQRQQVACTPGTRSTVLNSVNEHSTSSLTDFTTMSTLCLCVFSASIQLLYCSNVVILVNLPVHFILYSPVLYFGVLFSASANKLHFLRLSLTHKNPSNSVFDKMLIRYNYRHTNTTVLANNITYASRNLFTSARCSCDAVYSSAQ